MRAFLDQPDPKPGVGRRGIYVHIPFCLKRCDYCDFTTFADRDQAIPAYVEALTTHIGRGAAETAPANVNDVKHSGTFCLKFVFLYLEHLSKNSSRKRLQEQDTLGRKLGLCCLINGIF